MTRLEARVLRTLHRQQMIRDNRSIAVGVSGGKDSSLLLYLMARLRMFLRTPISLAAVRVIDIYSPCYEAESLSLFKNWCATLEVPLHLVPLSNRETSSEKKSSISPCFRCAWRRREALFKYAHSINHKIIALGHTAFDLAVTALMNLTYHGALETMPAKLPFFQGELTVIRPLSMITEAEVYRAVKAIAMPPPPKACRDNIGQLRHEMENLLRNMLSANPNVIQNILKAATRWSPPELQN
ncbi:hypothetical protein JW979_05600 [bacterium]|nr:hypothetical protein [candidate division CSSED10-310 bacterium]